MPGAATASATFQSLNRSRLWASGGSGPWRSVRQPLGSPGGPSCASCLLRSPAIHMAYELLQQQGSTAEGRRRVDVRDAATPKLQSPPPNPRRDAGADAAVGSAEPRRYYP